MKIRCSSIGKIMTEPKLKADKEAGNLSETAKSYVEELFLEQFGYRDQVMTEQMYKGILCEQESMQLVTDVLGGFRSKYDKQLENDYLTGHPDIEIDFVVEDIKTSWDIKTFFKAELSKDYYYQLQGYMDLLDLGKARLIYCLVNTPEEIVADLKKRIWYKFGCNEDNKDYIRMSQQIQKNHTFDHIPLEKRIKVFEIERDQQVIDKIYKQVEKARNYYNTLSL